MGRNKRTTKKFDHQFKLKGTKGTYYSGCYTVDFKSDKIKSIIPTFNTDQLFFTPTFIIPSLYTGNTAQYHEDYKKKVYNHQQISRDNILVPKPKSKHKICSVCRQQWEDYQSHIDSEEHKIRVRKNRFYQHIIELSQKYKRINEKEKEKSVVDLGSVDEQKEQKQFESTVEEDKSLKSSVMRVEC